MGRPHFSQISSVGMSSTLTRLPSMFFLGVLQALGKAFVEVIDGLDPVSLASLDNIQLFLHICAEFHIYNVGELLHHHSVDGLTQRGGFQLFWSFST